MRRFQGFGKLLKFVEGIIGDRSHLNDHLVSPQTDTQGTKTSFRDRPGPGKPAEFAHQRVKLTKVVLGVSVIYPAIGFVFFAVSSLHSTARKRSLEFPRHLLSGPHAHQKFRTNLCPVYCKRLI